MDRLSELKARKSAPSSAEPAVAIEMAEAPAADYVKDFDAVKKKLDSIKAHTDRIHELRKKADVQVKDSDEKVLMKELDTIMDSCKKEATIAKNLLAKLEEENKKFAAANPSSTTTQIRSNLLATNTRSFNTVMRDYQAATESFRDSLRQRIGRQARILKEDITDEQIEEVINSKNPGEFLKEAMGLSDALVDAVAELEERHERMKRIEQGVKEIQELFQDLALLVDEQAEHIDNIERNVAQTSKYTEQAEKELLKAEKTQKRSRKCMCFLFLLLIGVVIALIAGLVLGL